MNKFRILLGKELRELLTLQIIMPLVIIVIVFFGLGKVIGNEQAKSQETKPLVMLDLDQSAESSVLRKTFEQTNFEVTYQTEGDSESALATAREKHANSVVIVPSGFATNLNLGKAQAVETYSLINGFSIFTAQDYAKLKAGIAAVNTLISDQLIASRIPGTDPTALKTPVITKETVVVGEKRASAAAEAILAFINSQTTFIPIILFFVITFAAQMIATTIASEKENKTLETLLSLPVKRQHIVAAKMLAAGIVAAGASLLYLFGMRSYMTGLTGGSGGDALRETATSLGLTLQPSQYVLLGLSLFLAILVALAIALILGSFAEDIKSAQGLVAPVMVLILIPYLLTFFIDISHLSPLARNAIYAIPFAHPFLAAPSLMLGNYNLVWFGIAYQFLWFLAFLWIATRIFTTDRIVTLKLSFNKKKLRAD